MISTDVRLLRPGHVLARLALAAFVAFADALPADPTPVWIDADPAIGLPERDVDDGLALIQAFHSPEIVVRGLSVVFGNAPLAEGLPIAEAIARDFGPEGLRVFRGAAGAEELGRETDAVRGIESALGREKLAILALGPLTNVGSLLKLHPAAVRNIKEIIVVAGRRPGQRFQNGPTQTVPHPDFNFENDAPAMKAILGSGVSLVLAPWEVSSHVWITREDLAALNSAGRSGAYINSKCGGWLEMWEEKFGTPGFNPFDTLAVAWLTHPGLIRTFEADLEIVTGPDDRASSAGSPEKPYLLATPRAKGRPAVYCCQPNPEFKAILMNRLGGS